MDWLFDKRTDCWSVMTTMTTRAYLALVESAHEDKGGLSGQRDVLRTTTAKRLRERMVEDISRLAVLPPLVVGALVTKEQFGSFPLGSKVEPSTVLRNDSSVRLTIIDGMQRTAALREAASRNSSVLEGKVRVEFWLSTSVSAMIYRMLVLNTGQIPWTISRQLTVVYAPLLQDIKQNVPQIDKLFSHDSPGRRVGPAQFKSDDIIEAYIAFSLRKTAVDTKEALSEEFSRLDFVDNLSDPEFQPQFYRTLSLLSMLDTAFARHEGDGPERFSRGRHVFDGQPARIGFVVAVAQHVLGRPGLDNSKDERTRRIDAVMESGNSLIKRLNTMTPHDLERYLKLDVLSEILSKRVGQVGRYERNVFYEAFKVLIDENFDLPNMEPCWRAA